MSIRLTPSEFAATVEKFGKINARAARRGFTGRLEVTGTEVTETSTDEFGFDRTRTFIEAEGRAVKIVGTVKAHDEYNGTKSTVLTRCKEVAA